MFENESHSIPGRIVSLAQPWVRPIVRGKVCANTEFGAKSKENEADLTDLAPFTESYPVSDRPMFYLCENGVCRRPESEFEQLNL